MTNIDLNNLESNFLLMIEYLQKFAKKIKLNIEIKTDSRNLIIYFKEGIFHKKNIFSLKFELNNLENKIKFEKNIYYYIHLESEKNKLIIKKIEELLSNIKKNIDNNLIKGEIINLF